MNWYWVFLILAWSLELPSNLILVYIRQESSDAQGASAVTAAARQTVPGSVVAGAIALVVAANRSRAISAAISRGHEI